MKNIDAEWIRFEYQSFVAKATDENNTIDWNKIVSLLCANGDWTKEGAETLVAIVGNYGSFILRNALALAVATNTHDGQIGL